MDVIGLGWVFVASYVRAELKAAHHAAAYSVAAGDPGYTDTRSDEDGDGKWHHEECRHDKRAAEQHPVRQSSARAQVAPLASAGLARYSWLPADSRETHQSDRGHR